MYKIDYGHDILASQLAKIITIDEKTTIYSLLKTNKINT